jgi:Na+/melibiose symporter-like transporter
MWPRVTEILIAVWLASSPWIFAAPAESEFFLRANALACATLIALFALLSFRTVFGKAHLLTIAVALWMIGVAFAAPDPPPPAPYQNFVVVALLLLMIAVLPSRASEPPKAWRDFYR